MIITCPQCDTRFVVPSTVFMKGGRKVRCASCKHTWFHEEVLERASDNVNTPKIKSTDDKKSKNSKGFLTDFTEGYKIITAFAALVVIGYFAFQFMNPPIIMGQGLAFDNVTIYREGKSIKLTGDIVNAMDMPRGVPSIQITQYLADDVSGDKLIIKPDKDILNSGEAIEFKAIMDDIAPEIVDVKVSFFMGDSEDVTDTSYAKEPATHDETDIYAEEQNESDHHDDGAHH